jgi:PAS domain S-box-containing protein
MRRLSYLQRCQPAMANTQARDVKLLREFVVKCSYQPGTPEETADLPEPEMKIFRVARARKQLSDLDRERLPMSAPSNELKLQMEQQRQQLQACNENLRAVMTKSRDGILIVDRQRMIRHANPAAARIFGCTEHELQGKEYIYPLEIDRTAELHIQALDGSTVMAEAWVAEAEWNGDAACFVTLHDITERKMAEEALRESEEKFSRAFMAVPNLLIVATLPYERYVDVNEAFERTCGWRRDEVYGCTLAEIDIWENPADRSRLVSALQQEKRVRDLEIDFRNRAGESFVGLLSAELTELCGITCMITIITDITQRKRAEEALRQSEKKFAKVFRYVPSLLVVSSTLQEGRMIEVNASFEKVFKYTREEAIGRSALDLNLWYDPEDRIRAIQTIREKGEVRDLEIKFLDKFGKIFVGLYSATIIEIEGEDCLLSILNDITERKRQEEKIEDLNAILAARALELESANKELEAFSYSVSHDLRRPLTTINGYCQVVLESCGSNLGEQCRGYVREIYDGTLRMNELIDVLLTFSRLAHCELHRETVDLSGMAQAVAAELMLEAPERRVTFRITEGVTVDGDTNLLRVVLGNLLGNAWKYTSNREEARIEFGTAVIGGRRACFVRDNGTGFALSDAGKLFTPFNRLPGSGEFKGHGIGLATVERIIRRHGGQVWAEGEPGKGASFFFTLQP